MTTSSTSYRGRELLKAELSVSSRVASVSQIENKGTRKELELGRFTYPLLPYSETPIL